MKHRAARLENRFLQIGLALTLAACATPVEPAGSAASTPRVAPPGAAFSRAGADTARHQASGAAATWGVAVCSGLWIGGQTMEMIEAVNSASSPGELWDVEIDEADRVVSVRYDEAMPPRLVAWRPVLGCVQAPPGATRADLSSYPAVRSGVSTPDLDDQPWPTGDQDATASLPTEQQSALDVLVEAAFDGESYGAGTWGVVVVRDGKIVGERYDRGYGIHVGDQTHSAAKSFAASVVGVAVERYGLDIHAAPILDAWRKPGDPRGAITIEHLIRMSSGLYGEGNGSPQMDIYRAGGTVEGRAGSNMLDTMPGTRFLYNPPDTMLMARAVREHVGDDQAFIELPFAELFWKIGMTRTTPASDWNGDFLMSGQTYSTARDFTRFGLLYLADGVWNGERILPEGWADYVSTPGPAQPPGAAGYGGHFWLYGGLEGLPEGVYAAAGGQGQYIVVIPSENVVVVRRGHDAPGAGFQIRRFSADVLEALSN